MPRFSFDTNIPASRIPDDFLSKSASLLSKVLGKNIVYCVSTVNPGLKMTLGGTDEPCGLIQITSIGGIGPEYNDKCIEVLTDYLHEDLGIPKNKLCMRFQPMIQHDVGYLGTTFHQLADVEKRKRLM